RLRRAKIWLWVFAVCLAYTLYDGIYVRWSFSQRSKEFNAGLVTYNAPPNDVRAIQLHLSKGPGPPVTGQPCAWMCFRVLCSGRFDMVIIDYENPWGPGQEYRTYNVIEGNNCKSDVLTWRGDGRCITEIKSKAIEGRRFEVIVDREHDPMRPPWRSYY